MIPTPERWELNHSTNKIWGDLGMELIEITNLEEGLIELDKQLLHVDQEQYAVGKNDEGLQPVIKSVDGIHHCGMGEAGRMSSTWLKQTVQ